MSDEGSEELLSAESASRGLPDGLDGGPCRAYGILGHHLTLIR